MHIFALVGMFYLSPATRIDYRTAILCVISWQLASFGVTIGTTMSPPTFRNPIFSAL